MRLPTFLMVSSCVLAGIAAGCFEPQQEDMNVSLARALALVSATPPRLVIEIDHAPGRAPGEMALTHLVSTLHNVTAKADIDLVVAPLPDEPRFRDERDWSEWEPLHEEFFDTGAPDQYRAGHGDLAALHVLYLNGYALDTEGGQLYGAQQGRVIVVYMDRVRDGATSHDPAAPALPNIEADRVERAVLLHEVGHALGLVDNGAPMVRDRVAPDGVHSTNDASVMRAGVEGPYAVLDRVFDGQNAPYLFDTDDLADLRALRDGTWRAAGDGSAVAKV